MARPGHARPSLNARSAVNLLVAAGLAGFAGWAVISIGEGMLAVGSGTLQALWLLPALIGLHLFQLLLSAKAWGAILPQPVPLRRLYQLRIIREGIDSLLPVAQVGGEVVGAQLLARAGTKLAEAGASVVVDVTVEFLTQVVFLLAGIVALGIMAPGAAWRGWLGAVALTAALAAALVVAQRFGVLRLMEALARRIAARWPAAGFLSGMDEAAGRMYRRSAALRVSGGLHLSAWLLGSIESWAVLHALGFGISPMQALVIEALGMAARSAGFAVPGALVVQETGFALAAAVVGLPEAAGLSLSLVKRVREVSVGLLGLALWWGARRGAR